MQDPAWQDPREMTEHLFLNRQYPEVDGERTSAQLARRGSFVRRQPLSGADVDVNACDLADASNRASARAVPSGAVPMVHDVR